MVTMYSKSRLVEGVASGLLLLVLLLSSLFQSVSALPTFVPNCTLGGPHLSRNSEGNGELADGEFAVIVGGETLEVDEPMELEAGITYSISLESIGQGPGAISFRGHLLRLNEGDEGISTVNSFLVSDPSSQIAGACILQDQVGGLSHTDSDEKMQAQGQIRMLEADTNVVLEVWVVVRNCGPDSPLMPAPNTVESCDPAESMHYNSQYTLNFVAQQEASNSSIPSQMPSAAPSSAPSLSPTTMMPSDMPSSSPTSSPSTELPTLSPTVTVTGAPSLSYAPSTSTPTNSSQPAEMLSSLAPTVSPSPTVVPTSPAPSVSSAPATEATPSPVSELTPATASPAAATSTGTKSPAVATPTATMIPTVTAPSPSAASTTVFLSSWSMTTAALLTALFVGL